MGADDVAILRAGHRANHRSAFARAGCAPVDREAVLCARCRVRGNPDMVNPVGASHRQESLHVSLSSVSLNGDGPPKQTGLVTTTEINCSAAAGPASIAISPPNTTAINVGPWWDTMTVNAF